MSYLRRTAELHAIRELVKSIHKPICQRPLLKKTAFYGRVMPPPMRAQSSGESSRPIRELAQ
jgi:hypothetical protein